ncbi:hypothetical protein lerEdw1_012849 [Lerista edwardsae]|nr:hypothetical protein lerEdw1_012849 [Lerista edwardsae]
MATFALSAGRGAAYAAGAGLMGALAACCAKLALGADYLRVGCLAVFGGEEEAAAASLCAWLPMILRAGCGGLVFACNAVMWTLFAKALRYSASSATATVTSTASNFLSSVSISNTRRCGPVQVILHLHSSRRLSNGIAVGFSNTINYLRCSIFFQAFLGNLLFGETHSLLWWVGISVMLCGLVLLHSASPPLAEHRDPKEKKQ